MNSTNKIIGHIENSACISFFLFSVNKAILPGETFCSLILDMIDCYIVLFSLFPIEDWCFTMPFPEDPKLENCLSAKEEYK